MCHILGPVKWQMARVENKGNVPRVQVVTAIIIWLSRMRGITGPNQTWEIGRVSIKTRRYVGNREYKNRYGI